MASQPSAQSILALALAHITDRNDAAIQKIISGSAVPTDSPPETLRSIAFHMDATTIRHLNAELKSAGSPLVDEHRFASQLFQREPSAVIQRQVEDGQIKLNPSVKGHVLAFLKKEQSNQNRQNNQNVHKNQVSIANLASPESRETSNAILEGIPQERTPEVLRIIHAIQRIQSLASHPDTVPPLLNSGITSAHAVAQMPRSHFVSMFDSNLGAKTAAAVHDHATRIAFRNDSTMLNILQIVKGAGLAALDGPGNIDTRMATFQRLARANNTDINLEALFGGMDFCECDDCTTVLSPSSYFVELLQFLRNNTLDPKPSPDGSPRFPNTFDPSYKRTALDVLLQRRPDLQHIELTCANANTLIPYLDLANEVMESFVVHQDSSPVEWSPDAHYALDAFNVTDETSAELLCEAQHTNYQAYCLLLKQVFPLGALPYHQPLACIRIYLEFLTTSRYELMDVFFKPYLTPSKGGPYSTMLDNELSELYSETRRRATSSEYLGIIPEEYIILTKEAFWPKRYFEIIQNAQLSDQIYEDHIGVRTPWQYWGYNTDSEMLSNDLSKNGLLWVKKQFLSRSGLKYTDVVDLLKTKYVNPVYPTGRDLLIFENLYFSYRFLQRLLKIDAPTRKSRFRKLIDYLVSAQPAAEAWMKEQAKKECNIPSPPCREDYAKFVYRWFECLCNLVVLESGEGPTLPVHGFIVKPADADTTNSAVNRESAGSADTTQRLPSGWTTIGTLFTDGSITDNVDLSVDPTELPTGKLIGSIEVDSIAYKADGSLFTSADATTAINKKVDTATASKSTAAAAMETTVSEMSTNSSMLAVPVRSFAAYFIVAIHPVTRPRYRITAIIKETDSGLYWAPDTGPGDGPSLVRWNTVVDSCNINTVRILHLDGSSLSGAEWDNIHRFLRLRSRLGWSMDETDRAIHGLSTPPLNSPTHSDPPSSSSQIISWDDISDERCDFSKHGKGTDQKGCCDYYSLKDACSEVIRPEITPTLIAEVANVKKLQVATGLELIKLLALWDNISTIGNPSLYSQLFLTHNLLGIDSVFAADGNGNYLSMENYITDHLPVLLAAFNLKATTLSAILDDAKLTTAQLTLQNITLIYRYTLLAQVFQVPILLLIQAAKLMGYSFSSADARATMTFIENMKKIINSTLTVPQLAWIVNDDDPTQQYTPSQMTILQTATTLSKGLLEINATYPDPSLDASLSPMTDTDLQKLLTLLYEPDLSNAILSFLNGTKSYTTNAPAGLGVIIPVSLATRVVYSQTKIPGTTISRGLLIITGLLTATETAAAISLSSDSSWADAIHRVAKQAAYFYANYLATIFPDQSRATEVLLAGDNPESLISKKLFFLQNFMPYLRNSLARTPIVTTASSVIGLSSTDIVSSLLTETLTISTAESSGSQAAMDILLDLQSHAVATTRWTGYLVPTTTDRFTFAGYGSSAPEALIIDGVPVPFVRQQTDPNDVWFTTSIPLTGGTLYKFDSGGQPIPGLQWFTSRTMITAIPASSLIAETGSAAVSQVFVKLLKSANIIQGLNLSNLEVQFFSSKEAISHFDFDFDKPTFPGCLRMAAYCELRHSVTTDGFPP